MGKWVLVAGEGDSEVAGFELVVSESVAVVCDVVFDKLLASILFEGLGFVDKHIQASAFMYIHVIAGMSFFRIYDMPLIIIRDCQCLFC